MRYTLIPSKCSDVQLMAEEIKFARKLAETEPFKSAVVSEISPGPDCVTDAQIQGV